jgi:hypothetical protein
MSKRLTRGEHCSKIVEDGKVECLVWKDTKAVILINTICNPTTTTTVKRKGKDGQTSRIPCPESVKLYNQHMGGVDLADARRKTYSCSRRSKKWWHRLFYYLVDVSVVNVYILLAESPHCAKRTQKEFILELSEQLLAVFNSRKRPPHPSGKALPSTQYTGQHFPERSKKSIRCRLCSLEGTRKKSSYDCSSCNPQDPVHLCIDPCFHLWHTKQKNTNSTTA